MSEPMTSPNPATADVMLLPCPFCGSEARHEERHNPLSRWKHSIDCRSSSCGMSGPVASSKAEAVRLWNDRAALSAAKPPASGVDAVAGGVDLVAAINHAESELSQHIEKYHDYEDDTPERASLRDIQHHLMGSLIADDGEFLSPAATSGSEAGGEIDRLKQQLDIGRCASGRYFTHQECETLHHALAKPASSPAGGDVRDGALGWNSPEEWEIEQRAFHAAGRDDVPKDVQELVAILWKQYCIAAEPRVAMSPSTSAAEPVRGELPIWKEGWIAERLSSAMHAYLAEYVWSPDEGCDHEPTKFERMIMEDMLNGALSAKPVENLLQDAAFAMVATPPAPAAVDGQRALRIALFDLVEWIEMEVDLSLRPGLRKRVADAKALCERPRACLATDKEGA